jgi:DNA recombination protein RmuC
MIVGLLIVLLVLAAVGAAAVLVPRLIRGELGARNAEVDRRLAGLEQTLSTRLTELDQRVDTRLAASATTANDVSQKLGEVARATEEMIVRARDLGRLEQALRPPKARGGFGELHLEALLQDCLPPSAYELQYTFPTGTRVDAVVCAGGLLLPVDSKFTFDNFERMVGAVADTDRERFQKDFARDVKAKVDEIASRYILPAHGTFDFAFMYCPAESVYYEVVSGKTGQLLRYAQERRVYPVSSTTFHAYLSMILLGLKGMQIEERAQEVMAYCAGLQKDFAAIRTDFDLVGTHLGNAQKKFADAEKRFDKFETNLDRAVDEQVELDPPAQLPRALDAA